MIDSEYIAAVEELLQLRRDLEFLPQDERTRLVTRDLLGQARAIRQRIEKSLQVRSIEYEGGLTDGPDGLSINSTYLDMFTETGRWLTRARQKAPALFAQHFLPEPVAPIPFGFAAGRSSL